MKNLLDPIVPAKRGRPSKNAAVYIGGVLAIKEDERVYINSLVKEIALKLTEAEEKIKGIVKNYYLIGKFLYEVVQPRCRFTDAQIAEALHCSVDFIRRGIIIYKFFRNCPESLEGLKLTEALAFIKEAKHKEKSEVIQYALPKDDEDVCLQEFGLPTLSGIRLNNYRLRASEDGNLYLIQKGISAALPVANITVLAPKTTTQELAYKKMMEKTQAAFEEYYSVIERETEGE